MFFVVSTGRSGTMTISDLLSQHPLCECLHEPQRIVVRLATERSYDQLDDNELRFYLKKLFPPQFGIRCYGVSDQKLSYLIPLLAGNDGKAKFIWLIRDGRNVVASYFTRGAYGQEEAEDPKGSYRPELHNRYYWAKYRIQGDLCGDVKPELWKSMSPFEKCCWYWSYTNRTIERDLKKLDDDSWMIVRLEDLSADLDAILDFLDLPYYPLKMIVANRNPVPTYQHTDWNESNQRAFDLWCGAGMDCWYPNWRESGSNTQPGVNGHDRVAATKLLRSATSHVRWFGTKGVEKLKDRVGRER
jgi:hypothetical protein